MNQLPLGTDEQERAIIFNATKQLGARTKPFSPSHEDFRKQRPVIAVQWTNEGPAVWNITPVKSKKPNCVMKAKSKSEIDEYVGARIREGRLALNLSQEQLARALGVSFQQIQNYEKGANGVSAVRLFDICKILNVSLASMFPQDGPKDLPRHYTQPPLDHPTRAGMTN